MRNSRGGPDAVAGRRGSPRSSPSRHGARSTARTVRRGLRREAGNSRPVFVHWTPASNQPRMNGPMSLRYAYNTNGTGRHRLDDALVLIAEAGYDGVALTLDHHHFDPFAEDWERRAEALRRRLDGLGLASVVETGAHFLLDFRQKHEPTLISAAREGRVRRLDYLRRATDIAAIIGSESLTFWSGVLKPGVGRADADGWLIEGTRGRRRLHARPRRGAGLRARAGDDGVDGGRLRGAGPRRPGAEAGARPRPPAGDGRARARRGRARVRRPARHRAPGGHEAGPPRAPRLRHRRHGRRERRSARCAR